MSRCPCTSVLQHMQQRRATIRKRRSLCERLLYRTATITATDLQQEVEDSSDECELYCIRIYKDAGITLEPECAEAVYLPSQGRLGIAWGGDATWADAASLESGIEMWLNDGDAWDEAN